MLLISKTINIKIKNSPEPPPIITPPIITPLPELVALANAAGADFGSLLSKIFPDITTSERKEAFYEANKEMSATGIFTPENISFGKETFNPIESIQNIYPIKYYTDYIESVTGSINFNNGIKGNPNITTYVCIYNSARVSTPNTGQPLFAYNDLNHQYYDGDSIGCDYWAGEIANRMTMLIFVYDKVNKLKSKTYGFKPITT
jgi:hypothetical protein